jgi:hypothetical protein
MHAVSPGGTCSLIGTFVMTPSFERSADWRDLQQMEHVLGKYVISITVDHW